MKTIFSVAIWKHFPKKGKKKTIINRSYTRKLMSSLKTIPFFSPEWSFYVPASKEEIVKAKLRGKFSGRKIQLVRKKEEKK